MEQCPTMKERIGFRGYSSTQRQCAKGTSADFMVLHVGKHSLYRDANPASDEDFSENESTRMRVRTDDVMDTLACPE